ncbi:MAG: hypothetical protein WKG07_41365 [Hymenobacter sp.]
MGPDYQALTRLKPADFAAAALRCFVTRPRTARPTRPTWPAWAVTRPPWGG